MTELPYGGHDDPNSGYAGSDTSADRAHRDDESGVTGRRQQAVLNLLDHRAMRGATWQEVALAMGLHHGAASGVLSVLHKTGHVARLAETRSRCKVYVLPQYVLDRATEPHGRTSANGLLDDMAAMLRRLRDTGLMPARYQIDELLERHNRSNR